MRKTGLWLLPLATIVVGAAPPEDAAHRLDRLKTKRLNEAAARATVTVSPSEAVTRSPIIMERSASPRALTAGERALQEREERALSRWRSCRAGVGAACS